MQWTMIRPGMDPYRPILVITWVSGMRIDWYGMNIPNRIRVKITSEPRNFHFDSTYPLIDPMIDEMIAAGIASERLLMKLGASFAQASWKLDRSKEVGGTHIWSSVIALVPLKLVTSRM